MSLGAASQGQDTTLTLTTKTVQQTYLDHHPHGFSQGDEIIFAAQLFLGGRWSGFV